MCCTQCGVVVACVRMLLLEEMLLRPRECGGLKLVDDKDHLR